MTDILDDHLGESLCVCNTGKPYQLCCRPFHTKEFFPDTAEELMRSRYSAYALHLKSYLLETWHSSTRPGDFEFENGLSWQRLIINGRKKGHKNHKEGWVSFTAFFQIGLEAGQLQEKSYFMRDSAGHWCYVDGDIK